MNQQPLSRFPIVKTADPRSLRDAVDGLTGYEHSVHRPARPALPGPGTVNGLRLGGLSLIFVAYASQVSVLAPPTGDQVLVVLPLGPMGVVVAEQSWTMGTPFVLSASHQTQMFPHPHAGALVGAIPAATVQASLREIFQRDDDFHFELQQPRPITLHAGSALHRLWVKLAQTDEPTNATGLIDSIAIGLAPYTSYTQSHDAVLQPPTYLIAALQYLNRHFAEQISLTRLSEAIGISARQLQLSFRTHLGCTAQEYLRNIRLDRAYQRLTDGQPEDSHGANTISQVATEVGIPHLGRFAQYYAERFGHRPSEAQK